MKEKLVKLLDGFKTPVTLNGVKLMDWNIPAPQLSKELADFLIANGVTIPVRCKDCKHYMEYPTTKRMCCYVHLLTPHHMQPEHFCSYGERKTDG